MSGGSWDHFYLRLEDVADRLKCDTIPLRRALGEHLTKVVKALHDIEWVDSCDYGKGDDLPAIEAVLGKDAKAIEIVIVKEDARKILQQLESLLRDEAHDNGPGK